MRLLLISYRKTGTHQALQMIMHDVINIIDRSGYQKEGLEAWGVRGKRPRPQMAETAKALRDFDGKAFGHIAYLPEYAAAIRSKPTKVIFNVRDPRDVIVSEFETMKIIQLDPKRGIGHMNLVMPNGSRLMSSPDPIGELIKIAAIRWPHWLGWLDEDFVTVLKYEDLRLRPQPTIKRIIEALAGCPLPGASVMVMQMQDTDWSTSFRKGLVGEWKTTFTDEHKALAAELLTPIIERLEYGDTGGEK